jgi:hypothetical protein
MSMARMRHVKARVRFFAPDEGGCLVAPVGDGYAPYLRTSTGKQDLAVRVNGMPEQDGRFSVSYDVELELSYHPAVDYSSLQRGTPFYMIEGRKVVGEGEVTSSQYDVSPSQ